MKFSTAQSCSPVSSLSSIKPSTVKLLIPASVVEHQSDTLDEVLSKGVQQRTDATYLKIAQVRKAKRVCIDASPDDLAELKEECLNWLNGETFVSQGHEPEDRRFRSGYRALLEKISKALASS